jgi:hypothetical protein
MEFIDRVKDLADKELFGMIATHCKDNTSKLVESIKLEGVYGDTTDQMKAMQPISEAIAILDGIACSRAAARNKNSFKAIPALESTIAALADVQSKMVGSKILAVNYLNESFSQVKGMFLTEDTKPKNAYQVHFQEMHEKHPKKMKDMTKEERIEFFKHVGREWQKKKQAGHDGGKTIATEDSLNEAGGAVSWVKRWYAGKDDAIMVQVRNDLKKIKTEDDRKKLLTELDTIKRRTDWSNNSVLAFLAKLFLLGGLLAIIWTQVNKSDGTASDFIKIIDELEEQVKAYKIPNEAKK